MKKMKLNKMTIEEKQLLFKDLSARLPYGVRIWTNEFLDPISECPNEILTIYDLHDIAQLEIKPYLRPMSSMTEEEKEEYDKTFDWDYGVQGTPFDWLNAHHLDFRGLISMGLALEAPDWMY